MEHHNLSLLLNITVALVWAFAGELLARRLGLPSLVGYLLAGVAIGPFTPAFIGDTAQISQLAEIGVVFLMFGVGLHFSLRDLWRLIVPVPAHSWARVTSKKRTKGEFCSSIGRGQFFMFSPCSSPGTHSIEV